MKRFLLSLAALLVLSGNGFCLDLQTAKAQGLVGETPHRLPGSGAGGTRRSKKPCPIDQCPAQKAL